MITRPVQSKIRLEFDYYQNLAISTFLPRKFEMCAHTIKFLCLNCWEDLFSTEILIDPDTVNRGMAGSLHLLKTQIN